MHDHDPAPDTARLGVMDGPHGHVFLGQDHDRNARRTWAVIAITTVMMVRKEVKRKVILERMTRQMEERCR